MQENELPPSFEHVPNLRRPIVTESYCRVCSLFVGASSGPSLLLKAELDHSCSPWLKGLLPVLAFFFTCPAFNRGIGLFFCRILSV